MLIKNLLGDRKLKSIESVGVGVPGFVNRGRVFQAYNIGCDDFPFTAAVRGRLRVPVVVENDCNLFALGIHRVELGGEPRTMAGLFLGTGVGGGLILNGQLHRGINFAAGELGQMIVDRSGDRAPNTFRGSLESIASHVGLVRHLRKAIRQGRLSCLEGELGKTLRGITGGHIRAAVDAGDRLAVETVRQAAEATGVGVASLISALAPERVMLGGGLMEALGEVMLPVIQKTAKANVLPRSIEGIRIGQTKLGGDGAIYGAAVLARDMARARD